MYINCRVSVVPYQVVTTMSKVSVFAYMSGYAQIWTKAYCSKAGCLISCRATSSFNVSNVLRAKTDSFSKSQSSKYFRKRFNRSVPAGTTNVYRNAVAAQKIFTGTPFLDRNTIPVLSRESTEWCSSKSETILFTTGRGRQSVDDVPSLQVSNTVIQPSATINSLDVTLDRHNI